MNPNRAMPASTNKTPVNRVSKTMSAIYRSGSPPANGPRAAAAMMQVAVSGPVINWREEPKGRSERHDCRVHRQ